MQQNPASSIIAGLFLGEMADLRDAWITAWSVILFSWTQSRNLFRPLMVQRRGLGMCHRWTGISRVPIPSDPVARHIAGQLVKVQKTYLVFFHVLQLTQLMKQQGR